jgi:hypothetical protein
MLVVNDMFWSIFLTSAAMILAILIIGYAIDYWLNEDKS